MLRSALSVLVITLVSAHVVHAQAKAPNVVTKESTITAVVDRIDDSSRILRLRLPENLLQNVYVEPSLKVFDELKVGDRITVRYAESIVVQVRRGAQLSDTRDVTAEAQKTNGQVIQQLKAVVKIEGIDSQGLSIEYRTQDGQKVLHPVADKRLLEGLRVGDQIEVTLTRERAINIQRAR
jgi:hypothetical protein